MAPSFPKRPVTPVTAPRQEAADVETPKLTGQNAAYMVEQMKDIKSGARNNGQTAAMKGVMHLVNDDEIKAIADFLSKLKP